MVRIAPIAKKYYPELLWQVDTAEKDLYLTFDDGPTPGVTDWVLDELGKFKAKATFFCLGKNVRQHPEIYERIINEGHAVGNHTYNHPKGWVTANFRYLRSVVKCAEVVQSNLFRPPYGRIKKTQIKALIKQYKIVMWDVLSEDYNTSVNSSYCLKKVLSQAKGGSIIVFHDSQKAMKNLGGLLPQVLQHYTALGYQFRVIPS